MQFIIIANLLQYQHLVILKTIKNNIFQTKNPMTFAIGFFNYSYGAFFLYLKITFLVV